MKQIFFKTFSVLQLISVLAFSECTVTVWLHPAEAVESGAAWRLTNGEWHGSGEQAVITSAQLLNFREIEGWRKPERWLLKVSPQSSTVVVWYTREVTGLDSLALSVEASLGETTSGKVMLTARDGASSEYIAAEDVLATEENSISACDDQGRTMEWDTQPLAEVMEWRLRVRNPLGKELSLSWNTLRAPAGMQVFLRDETEDEWQELAEDGNMPLGAKEDRRLFFQVRLQNVQNGTLELLPGWNAVSLNMDPAPVTLARILSLKPFLYASASRCYALADTLSAYQPFWVFAREKTSLPLIGYLPNHGAERAEADWMFLAVEEETALPDTMVAFEWDGAHYRQVQIMTPGRAYWLASDGSYGPIPGEDDGNRAQ
ncbi:MAG: hypothetical protein IJJ33_06595 [Victivallales bacterium]|nr:hypothetical protein [Victivallales bacterium]